MTTCSRLDILLVGIRPWVWLAVYVHDLSTPATPLAYRLLRPDPNVNSVEMGLTMGGTDRRYVTAYRDYVKKNFSSSSRTGR